MQKPLAYDGKPMPDMAKVWARLKWDLVRLLNPSKWSDINPYVAAGEGDAKPKKRTAWEDITHALKNLVVEGIRHFRGPTKAGIPD